MPRFSRRTPPRLTATYTPTDAHFASGHPTPRVTDAYTTDTTPLSPSLVTHQHSTVLPRVESPLTKSLTPPIRETVDHARNLHTHQAVSLHPFEPYIQQLIDSAVSISVDFVPTANDLHLIPKLPDLPPLNKALLPPFPHCSGKHTDCTTNPLLRPQVSSEFAERYPQEAHIYSTVREKGAPNFRGARMPLSHKLNIPEWRRLAFKFNDAQLPDFLEFGFPTGYISCDVPTLGLDNHASAARNPLQIKHYIETELSHRAIMGPFSQPPFQDWFRTNPMLTRPKRDSDKLRVILDLSFPIGHSVNDGIPSCQLDGSDFKLRLPTIHQLAARIVTLGRGCHLYKVDLSRAYRQLRSDPWDWPLLGISWDDALFLDVAIPFGLRHGASACQRVTEAVAAIAKYDVQADAHAYIDDTAGAALPDVAPTHYRSILDTMDILGLDRAPDKCQSPATTLTWVGVFLDTDTMTMSIDKDRCLRLYDFVRISWPSSRFPSNTCSAL